MNTAAQVIDTLGLEPHPEGGYFRRTFTSDETANIGPNDSARPTLTCIYYLLTNESPIGHLHVNRSDIVHFFHAGSPIEYTLVDESGNLTTTTLGPDIGSGHQFQLHVPGGRWKASELQHGRYGLISEAVSPGFNYEDMRFVSSSQVASRFPHLGSALQRLTRSKSP